MSSFVFGNVFMEGSFGHRTKRRNHHNHKPANQLNRPYVIGVRYHVAPFPFFVNQS